MIDVETVYRNPMEPVVAIDADGIVAFAHDRMGELIENVLSLSRHGDLEPEVQSVDLATTIEDCRRNVQTAGATIAVDTAAVVRAERSRRRQLLVNLFRNAIDHGGSNVTVSVGDLDDGFYRGRRFLDPHRRT